MCVADDVDCTGGGGFMVLSETVREPSMPSFSRSGLNFAPSVRRAFIAAKRKNLGSCNRGIEYFDCAVADLGVTVDNETLASAYWLSE